MNQTITQEVKKTPISYYGGKQQMLNKIIPKIPSHKVYVEPFFGGGAVFFAKTPSDFEVVNDINTKVVTFYKTLRDDFEALKFKVDETFHSREQHRDAGQVYKQEIEDEVSMAWAVWVQTNMSFGCQIGSGFGYGRDAKCAFKLHNKKARFTKALSDRLTKVTIENNDVIKVIKTYDTPDTFFYLDPPYVSANQGHYAGYTSNDFKNLLDVLTTIKGKFLLSTYPEEMLLEEYIPKNGWQIEQHIKHLAVDGRRAVSKTKTECLTFNYSL